ncbi:exopolyphosphatase/guanosine-5'-triphosphate,3'-diphosphate pyrophosphatase [Palleronia aestuarii]|uniref:Exopolyphosphatase/guanosine-5'-triphosphate, 3'-diphosphate pyrophosphatase n=1 Tax=Palleronia aestuarii TaxID=568105 RepID=A0A2W7N368_9RHOB|nr:Ppx/GppA family phosphatase [Palleronia aestuarii]PZX14508.1 exopolyphosphatase/guanosine-5'-triphosphate,3'-diphosphate pyrophosphatase [Palleronia aestuarii]
MPESRLDIRETEPRVIEIETARVLARRPSHFAVLDIGSNSIRLVVYDDLSRAPFPRFNEKSLARLGAGYDAEGNFTEDAMERATHAVRRFAAIAQAMGVERLDAIATDAIRRAGNGAELLDRFRALGIEVRVLGGEEEASFAGRGVISGFFQPRGLVGDIGGGSLDVAEVLGDRVGARKSSMPLGALPVTRMLEDGVKAAKKEVDAILEEGLPPLLTDPVFYAVGGGWRALARVHIARTGHPISVVHGYELPRKVAQSLAKEIAKMDPDEIAALDDVPSRRIDTTPAAALVLWRVLKRLKPDRVVFSACGLREGWLYDQLSEEEQYRDPLLETAMAIGLPSARVPDFAAALADWTEGLFPGETQGRRRLRLAACALTDLCWRDHQKIRDTEAYSRVLQFPFIGVRHAERVFLATVLRVRYGGKVDDVVEEAAKDLLSASDLRRAEILGRALLLGHRFSAGVPDLLTKSRVRIDSEMVRLEILDPGEVPDTDAIQSRVDKLAKSAKVSRAEIVEAD